MLFRSLSSSSNLPVLIKFSSAVDYIGFGGLAKIEVTTANTEKTKNVDKEVS